MRTEIRRAAMNRLRAGTGSTADLAAVLGYYLFDSDDAATFLGVTKTTLFGAAYRRRIPFVQYGSAKFFARADLQLYGALRGRGHKSELVFQPSYVVKAAAKAHRGSRVS